MGVANARRTGSSLRAVAPFYLWHICPIDVTRRRATRSVSLLIYPNHFLCLPTITD
jgi:hypothetical protein